MISIPKESNNNKQKIRLCSSKDFDVSYFCGPGKGGSAKNKVHSGVNIIHRESGASGRASDSRSQPENKANAFQRLVKTPQFKFWVAKKLYELEQNETLEETVLAQTKDEFLKFEIKDENGKWVEVAPEFFNSIK